MVERQPEGPIIYWLICDPDKIVKEVQFFLGLLEP
jgi:hypothetical protein